GQLVGAAVAGFCAPADAGGYSLVAGGSPGAGGGGVGLALKLAQGGWGLGGGAGRVGGAFGPPLRRQRGGETGPPGAVGTEYWVDFYGEVADGVNDPETDRLAVAWDLRAPLPASAARAGGPGSPGPAGEGGPPAILVPGPGGEPVAGTVPGARARPPCWIPGDIPTTRPPDPG